MTDLVCLVADKSLEAALAGLLVRPAALGIRTIQAEIIVHPHRDPGCFHEAAELLRGYHGDAAHAIVMLDRAWEGAPAPTGEELERHLSERLRGEGLAPWAEPIVIDPELEVWVFSDSPHVEDILGWAGRVPALRAWLAAEGLWPEGVPKPPDPKAAVDLALREVRRPRSSSVYRRLAERVSVEHCTDRAFARLRSVLSRWFGTGAGERVLSE